VKTYKGIMYDLKTKLSIG